MFSDTSNNAGDLHAAAQQASSDKTPRQWVLKIFLRRWRELLYDNQISIDFAEAINDMRLCDVKSMITDPKIKVKINPFFKNNNGDTFLHLAVKQGQWDYVTPVINIGCVNYIANNQGLLPFDITRCFKDVVGHSKPNLSIIMKEKRNKPVTDMSDYYRENWSGGIFPGKRVTDNLNLYFECEEGRCEIPDSWVELDALDFRWDLSIHRRLAIANHLSSSRAVNVESMNHDNTPNCYITAAFTMVVTTESIYSKKPPYKLRAITIAINVPEYMVYTSGEKYAHGEKILWQYIDDNKVLCRLIEEVKIKGSIVAIGHKCYGVILDMHITYNMCNRCEEKLYDLISDRTQNSFMLKLETTIEDAGFKLPQEIKHFDLLVPYSTKIFFTPRVSCQYFSFYEESINAQAGTRDNRGHLYREFEEASNIERNIATHRNAVIFHTTHQKINRKYLFSTSTDGDRSGYVNCYVPNQTAFVMKPNPDASWRRRNLAQPVLFSDKGVNARSGLYITKNNSQRFDEANEKCIGGGFSNEQDEAVIRLSYYQLSLGSVKFKM